MDKLPSRLVLFDGVCNLCNGSVQFIIAHDPAALFFFASLQSVAGQQVLQSFKRPTTEFDTFIYIRDGQVFDRSTAALRVLIDIGGFWRLMHVFILIPRPLRDLIYNIIARSRYGLFGKRDICMVPTPDLRARFL